MASNDALKLRLNAGRAKELDRVKGEGFSLQFTTLQDVDAVAARAKHADAKLESEPADAWGARVFRIRDPDGFRLVIFIIARGLTTAMRAKEME